MKPKLVQLEDVTLERILAAKAVRASDGCISRLLWENPMAGPTADLFVSVEDVTDECVSPVKRRVANLLLHSQQDDDTPALAGGARACIAAGKRT
jgi:hypothetical protein